MSFLSPRAPKHSQSTRDAQRYAAAAAIDEGLQLFPWLSDVAVIYEAPGEWLEAAETLQILAVAS